MSATIPEDSPGAKAYDRMQMNIFADIHKGAQMFLVNEDLDRYSDLGKYRDAVNHQLTFRKALFQMSRVFLSLAACKNNEMGAIVTPTFARSQQTESTVVTRVPNSSRIRRRTVAISLSVKETGDSPKRKILKRLREPNTKEETRAAKRFKVCEGSPIFRVTEDKGEKEGPGAEGR